MAQIELTDVAGASATISAIGLKAIGFLNLADINEIVVTITALAGLFWLFFKIKISYYDYKEKKKNYEKNNKRKVG